jgi:hypothetical protein
MDYRHGNGNEGAARTRYDELIRTLGGSQETALRTIGEAIIICTGQLNAKITANTRLEFGSGVQQRAITALTEFQTMGEQIPILTASNDPETGPARILRSRTGMSEIGLLLSRVRLGGNILETAVAGGAAATQERIFTAPTNSRIELVIPARLEELRGTLLAVENTQVSRELTEYNVFSNAQMANDYLGAFQGAVSYLLNNPGATPQQILGTQEGRDAVNALSRTLNAITNRDLTNSPQMTTIRAALQRGDLNTALREIQNFGPLGASFESIQNATVIDIQNQVIRTFTAFGSVAIRLSPESSEAFWENALRGTNTENGLFFWRTVLTAMGGVQQMLGTATQVGITFDSSGQLVVDRTRAAVRQRVSAEGEFFGARAALTGSGNAWNNPIEMTFFLDASGGTLRSDSVMVNGRRVSNNPISVDQTPVILITGIQIHRPSTPGSSIVRLRDLDLTAYGQVNPVASFNGVVAGVTAEGLWVNRAGQLIVSSRLRGTVGLFLRDLQVSGEVSPIVIERLNRDFGFTVEPYVGATIRGEQTPVINFGLRTSVSRQFSGFRGSVFAEGGGLVQPDASNPQAIRGAEGEPMFTGQVGVRIDLTPRRVDTRIRVTDQLRNAYRQCDTTNDSTPREELIRRADELRRIIETEPEIERVRSTSGFGTMQAALDEFARGNGDITKTRLDQIMQRIRRIIPQIEGR